MPHLVAHPQVLQVETGWYLWDIANMSCRCCSCQARPASADRVTSTGTIAAGGCHSVVLQTPHETTSSCSMSLYGNCQQTKGL